MKKILSFVLVLVFVLILPASGAGKIPLAQRIEQVWDSYKALPKAAQRTQEMIQEARLFSGQTIPLRPKTSGSYYYNGYLSYSDKYDNVSLTVDQPCFVVIDITAYIYDMNVALFDSARENILCMPADSNAFGGTSSSPKTKSMGCFLDAGTYYIFASYDYYTGSYRLDIDVYDMNVDEVEPNNSTSSANTLTINGSSFTGLITAAGNEDYYSFDLPYDDYTRVYVGAYIPYLGWSVLDSNSNSIFNVNSYNYDGEPDKLVWTYENTNKSPGKYYVKVKKATSLDIDNIFRGLFYQGPYEVMVKVGPDSLNMSQSTLKLGLNMTGQLYASPIPSEAKSIFQWESSKPSIASVSSGGLVTGLTEGTATITAKARNNVYCSCQVTVKRVECTSLTINSSPQSLFIGSSLQLKTSYTPANMQEKVTWSSNNQSISSVDENGLVTAKGLGKATITVSVPSGKSDSRTLTVMPVMVSSLSLKRPEKTVFDLGANFNIQYSVLPDNATNKSISWKSSNVKVATVNGSGQVSTVGKGDVTITAMAVDGSSAKDSVTFKVVSLVHDIAISGISTLTSGYKSKLSLTVLPSSANSKAVLWTSSNNTVATVNSKGEVTALNVVSPTFVTVTATAKDGSNVQAKKEIQVVPRATSVSINTPSSMLIDLASNIKSLTLTATVSPKGASQNVNWGVSNKKIARISTDGVLTGLKPGKVIVSATTKDGSSKKSSITIQIASLVKSISINGAVLIASGRSMQMAAVVSPANATNKSVSWSSSDNNIASVDKNGKVLAQLVNERHTIEIIATAKDGSGVTSKKTLTVCPSVANIQLLYAAGTKWSLSNNGRTLKLEAAISPLDAIQDIAWSTSNAKVASVVSDGTVTFKRAGAVRITASTKDGSGKKASITFSVSK